MIKICFFGTGFYAAKILESLYQDRFQILKVISQTDKKQGRGLKKILSQSSKSIGCRTLRANFLALLTTGGASRFKPLPCFLSV